MPARATPTMSDDSFLSIDVLADHFDMAGAGGDGVRTRTKNLSVNNVSTIFAVAASQGNDGCGYVVKGEAVSD